MKSGIINLTETEVLLFYLSLITIVTTFASFIYGTIVTGRSKAAIKYLPIFFAIGLIIFFLTKFLLNRIFFI